MSGTSSACSGSPETSSRLILRRVSGVVGEPQEFVSRLGVFAKSATKGGSNGLGVLLLHPAHHHAEVVGLDHHPDSGRLEHAAEPIGDLLRQPLLDLEALCVDIHNAWDPRIHHHQVIPQEHRPAKTLLKRAEPLKLFPRRLRRITTKRWRAHSRALRISYPIVSSPLRRVVYGLELDNLETAGHCRQLENHCLANAPSDECFANGR